MRGAYAAKAVQCSVGHLTTYGPIDSPTSPPYLGTAILTILCRGERRIIETKNPPTVIRTSGNIEKQRLKVKGLVKGN